MRFKILTVVALVFFVGACTTHKSPLQEAKGSQFLFVTNDEEAVFRAAYESLVEAGSSFPVADLDGPVRGYSMNRILLIDNYITMVRVYPATGLTSTGEEVFGYYPEVSGAGTLFDGPGFDDKVYQSLLNKLAAIGKRTTVHSLNRGKYIEDRDRWRLTNSPSLREGGSITIRNAPENGNSRTVEERLRDLEELRKAKAISETEYQDLRRKILSDL